MKRHSILHGKSRGIYVISVPEREKERGNEREREREILGRLVAGFSLTKFF